MNVLYTTDLREKSSEYLKGIVSDKSEIYNQSFDSFIQTLTPAKKKLALAVIELYKRDKERTAKVDRVKNSSDIYKLMYNHLYGVEVEEFWIVFMNNANKPLKVQRFTIGGIDSALVDIRMVIKEALLCNSTRIIAVHNHPSGNVKPSSIDDKLTDQLKKAAKYMEIILVDHIVFSDNGYYSYKDNSSI